VDEGQKKVVAVCGPTGAGKSELSDDLADRLSAGRGERTPVVVVDSMQVYSGIEKISNQARRRRAELVSVVPVTERWTVARHARATLDLVSASGTGVVLDAGTGMYLNAVLMRIPIAPEVPDSVRAQALLASTGLANPRRASRALELELAGAPARGSIWDGEPRYDTTLLYLRPEREALDGRIAQRSARIVAGGLEEAREIRTLQRDGHTINPSVIEAVGVREMLALVDGDITPDEAQEKISARTRRLARRQLRWFDKLTSTLKAIDGTRVTVAQTPADLWKLHTMHDTITR
jgi:tRNA dimethylallyltransferase